MKPKGILLLNGVWILIACCVFFIGRKSGLSEPIDTSDPEGNSSVSLRNPKQSESSNIHQITEFRKVSLTNEEIADLSQIWQTKIDPQERQKAFSLLLESLTADNIQSVVERLHAEVDRDAYIDNLAEFRLLMNLWGRLDGEAALEYCNEGMHWTTVISAIEGRTIADPDGAKGWLAQMKSEDYRRKFAEGIVGGLLQRDRDATSATDYIFSLPAEEQDRDQLEVVLKYQLKQEGGVQGAISWAENLPRGELKRKMVLDLAEKSVKEDLEVAKKWAVSIADKDIGPDIVAKVAEEWAEEQPAEAMGWVTSLNDGEARNRAMTSALREWSRRDMIAAGEFVNNLAPGSMRDAASSQYAEDVWRENPDTAKEWAQAIENQELRSNTLKHLDGLVNGRK